MAMGESTRPVHRKTEQLITLGKATTITAVKVETDRDARWVGKVAPRGSPSLRKSCCW